MDVELTPEKMLEEVNKAIYAIMVGGQSYKIGSRELTRANLAELKELRIMLKSEVAEAADGLMENTTVAEFLWR
jgi:hypothetical protein